MKDEVENYKEDNDVEKKDSIMKIILENQELILKKIWKQTECLSHYESELWYGHSSNNELKVKVDDQQVDINI